jgi:glyceraldehyde 3-phosphate dehydrogenase
VARVAINGLGRIGRAAFKIVLDTPELDLVAANDVIPIENIAYLLQYDTVYGRYEREVGVDGNHLVVDGRSIPVYSEKDPAQLPWGDLDIDVVFECTGLFTRAEEMRKHLQAGARTVILSAPVKSSEERSDEPDVITVVHGVNSPEGDVRMISCASCTTNAITPVVEIMGRRIGVRKAIMTTVHAYTSSQKLVDGPSKDMRRGRAGAANLVPTSTGAAIATTKVLTDYQGLFDGVAIRAPVPSGSIADITFATERPTSVEEVNEIFRQEAESDRYGDVVSAVEAPLVSSDIIRNPHAAIIDLEMTQVVDGDLVKVMSWYDNEWGFTAQMVREAVEVVQRMEPTPA